MSLLTIRHRPNYFEGKQWPALMVDLETYSTRSSAAILQIGYVAFDPASGDIGPGEEIDVDWRSQHRHVDPGTVAWWSKQQQAGCALPDKGNVSLAGAMRMLADFCAAILQKKFTVWAWGASFDLAILEDAALAFAASGELPWRYSRHRCARTLCALADVSRDGSITHSALEDTIQAAAAVQIALDKIAAPTIEPDFERGWMRYRRELAETHPCIALLPAWADCPMEVRESFVAGVLSATEPQPPQNL